MRIAVVSDAYAPRLGGIEAQVGDLAHHLAAAGHEPEVFTITPVDSAGESPEASAPVGPGHGVEAASAPAQSARMHPPPYGGSAGEPPVHRFPSRVLLPADMLVNPAARGPMRRALKQGRFDVVHAHVGVLSPFAVDTVEIACALGIPTVVTWHSLLPTAARAALRATGLLDRWHRQGTVFTAVSKVAARRVEEATHADVEVSVLPNGLDLARWRDVFRSAPTAQRAEPTPTTNSTPTPTLRLVSAMRLAPIKRPLALLRAAARARGDAPGTDVTVQLIGDGPLRGRIERWIDRHRAHDWIELPGRLPRDDLAARYRPADLYVSPARQEAFGIAPLEALRTGLPVLGLASSGVSEYVEHEVNGLLVTDDAALGAALAQLARHPDQLVALQRSAREARPRTDRFDWANVIAATEDVYRVATGARD